MLPLYHEPHFTFRFNDACLIPRFHLKDIHARKHISVFRIDPGSGKRLDLLMMTTVGEDGWVDLREPIMVRAGDTFVAVPEQAS